jgi:hypothetical protein
MTRTPMRTVRQAIEDLDVDAYLARGEKLLDYQPLDKGDLLLVAQAIKTLPPEEQRRIACQMLRVSKWMILVTQHRPPSVSEMEPIEAYLFEEELLSLWRKSALE